MATRCDDQAVGAPVPVVDAERDQRSPMPQPSERRRAAPCPTRAGMPSSRSDRLRDDARARPTPSTNRTATPSADATQTARRSPLRLPCTAARRRRTGAGRFARRPRRPARSRGWNARARVERDEQRRVGVVVEVEVVGHAAAVEHVRRGARRSGGSCVGCSNRRMPTSSLGTSLRPVDGARRRAAAASPRRRGRRPGRSRARTAASPLFTRDVARLPPGGQRRDARDGGRRRDRLGHQDHHVVRCRTSARRRSAARSGVNMPYTFDARPANARRAAPATRSTPARAPPLQRDRPALRRERAELGDEVAPVLLHAPMRSCVGLAMPRAAANASAISSGVK